MKTAFTCVSLLLLVISIGGLYAAEASPKPNIIIILADDMGYGDCTVNNPDSKIPTPHIDRLAREGLRFTDGHSASTVCTPSRYGLLTGINPAREGITNTLLKYGNPMIDEGTPTIATLLRDHGYTTKMVGKWHLGFHMKMSNRRAQFDFSKPLTGGPLDCGFDYYYGVNKAPSAAPFFYIRNRKPLAEPTELIGTKPGVKDGALTWLPGAIAPGFVHDEVMPNLLKESLNLIHDHAANKADKSLFLYLSLTAPHTPLVPSKAFVDKSKIGPYGDFILEIDDLVGKVDAALKEADMDKNTILIFSSDNGALLIKGNKEKHGHSVNGVLRGGKAHPYEGGHRVPFIVKWPNVVPASTATAATVNHTDLFATLMDILGLENKEKYLASAIDSYSFLPVLKNPSDKFVRPPMFNNNSTCRIGDWKIVVPRKAFNDGGAPDQKFVELYNLKNDLSETTDMSRENPERLEELVKCYTEFRSQWSLRPEAEQLKKEKSQKTGQSRKPKTKTFSTQKYPGRKETDPNAAAGVLQVPKDVQLSEEQKTRVDALVTEYRRRMAELREKLANVLTDQQKQARAAAKKKALEDGKKGAALRAAADAAVNLTDKQQKRLQDLQQAMGQLTREYREKLREMLTDEQKVPLSTQDQAAHTLKSAKTCKECHEQHYAEWENSAHAHFSRKQNVPFLKLAERQKDPKKLSWCQGCHEPLRPFSDHVSDSKIIAEERITCDFCHSVQIDHPQDKFKLHPSGAKQGPIESADSPEHPVAHSKEITSSDFCLVCHHKSRKRHRELREQFPTELINCQNCHMPLRNDGSNEHSHSFPGRYSEEMLQKAFEFDVAVEEVDAGMQIDINMKNIVNAHSVPPAASGYSHIVLLVSAYDVSNKIVWKNWELKPSKDLVFSSIQADSRGNVPAAIFVRAKESKGFQYLIENKTIRWVEARLLAYALAPHEVARMGLKDAFYTRGRTMAFRRLYSGNDN